MKSNGNLTTKASVGGSEDTEGYQSESWTVIELAMLSVCVLLNDTLGMTLAGSHNSRWDDISGQFSSMRCGMLSN